ncbi:MAG: sulfatase family protein, partial [Pirellulaceae bacterium]
MNWELWRKNYMSKTLVCLAIGNLCAGCLFPVTDTNAWQMETRPNIVIVLADDMGYGEIQALNPERGKIPTPHLDQLVRQGLTFTDAHSASSVCTPSRYALLTGRYCWRSQLQNGVVVGNDDPLIAADRLTLASLLSQHGYTTGIIGKWHLNYNYEGDFKGQKANKDPDRPGFQPAVAPIGTRILDGPLARGFDSFFGFHHSREMSSLVRDDRIVEEINVIDMLPRLTTAAVDFIDTHAAAAKQGTPFFLYFPLSSPHTPIVPGSQWQGKSGLGNYGDFVMQTDDTVGAVIDALERNGVAENTLLIFSADNGTSRAAGITELQAQGHFPSAHLRGSKADIWDGGHRVPFVLRWPEAQVEAGSTTDHLVCHSDFMATMAELLEIDLPETAAEDSFSFYPLLTGQPVENGRRAIVHHSVSGRFAIRRDNWKLNLCAGSGGWSSPREREARQSGLPAVQLYDMSVDIGERQNRINEQPELVAELLALLEKYIAD